MNAVLEKKEDNPTKQFSKFMDGFKGQIALALPKHLSSDRMCRLAVTAFSSSQALQSCDAKSIVASIVTASTLGLEIGVNGQGYLVPYKGKCQFVPGWKGIQDIANRSGRCTTWTGAVFEGDDFDYAMGDRPFIKHKPGDGGDDKSLKYVYAVGRVVGSEWPVIDVWSVGKARKHRDRYNKVGTKHYSFENFEMYARKIVLLQVLKYMPCSIEMSQALDISNAQESGKHAILDGDFVTVSETQETPEDKKLPELTAEVFAVKSKEWKDIIEAGMKTPDELIAMLGTKNTLSDEQKKAIQSYATTQETA
jgi:recombination protein RecT